MYRRKNAGVAQKCFGTCGGTEDIRDFFEASEFDGWITIHGLFRTNRFFEVS